MKQRIINLIKNTLHLYDEGNVKEFEKKISELEGQLYEYKEDKRELEGRCEQLHRWALESKQKYSVEYVATNAMRYALARQVTDDAIKDTLDTLLQENFKLFDRAEKAEKKLIEIAAMNEQERLLLEGHEEERDS